VLVSGGGKTAVDLELPTGWKKNFKFRERCNLLFFTFLTSYILIIRVVGFSIVFIDCFRENMLLATLWLFTSVGQLVNTIKQLIA